MTSLTMTPHDPGSPQPQLVVGMVTPWRFPVTNRELPTRHDGLG